MVMVPFKCGSYAGQLMVASEKIINSDNGNSSLLYLYIIQVKTNHFSLQTAVSFMLPPDFSNGVQLPIHYVRLYLAKH